MQRIGHRGAKAYVAENTLASIAKALELGADAIEVDVHCCKSGEVVVIHDTTVNRTTVGSGNVRNKTLGDLKLLSSDQYSIPTLQEVLLFCEGKCSLHIELKGKGTAIKVAEMVTNAVCNSNWTYDMLFVSSFKFKRLKKVTAYNPKITIGIIVDAKLNAVLKQVLNTNCAAIYISYDKIKGRHIVFAKKNNMKVFVWTVNSHSDIQKMKALSVDGIITDFPDFL